MVRSRQGRLIPGLLGPDGQLLLDRKQGFEHGHLQDHLAVFLPVAPEDAEHSQAVLLERLLAYLPLVRLNISRMFALVSGEDRRGDHRGGGPSGSSAVMSPAPMRSALSRS